MKFVKKAEGAEIFPNLSFWKSLPFLVKVSSLKPNLVDIHILQQSKFSKGNVWLQKPAEDF